MLHLSKVETPVNVTIR